MSSLLVKYATKSAEKKAKAEMKGLMPKGEGAPKRGEGPRLRKGDGLGDKMQGCCNKCCGAVCRTSPWTQALCWAMIGLIISAVVMLLGGAMLTSVARNAPKGVQCGVKIQVPLVNKDAYVFFLGTSGIIILIMIASAFVCGCSIASFSFSSGSKSLKICGCVGMLITTVALVIFLGWLAFGTFLVVEMQSGAAVCRNTLIYLVLMYVYLVVLILVAIVAIAWKCNSWRKSWKESKEPKPQKTSKGKKR